LRPRKSAQAAASLPQGDCDHHWHHASHAQQGNCISARNQRTSYQELLLKIYDKLGVKDRLELAQYDLHNKIIKSDVDEFAVVQRLLAKPRD
jgi:hypothetical protein